MWTPAQKIATPAFARANGLIAYAVAAYAAQAVDRRIGSHQDAADVRRWAMRVRGYLTDHDLANSRSAGLSLAPAESV